MTPLAPFPVSAERTKPRVLELLKRQGRLTMQEVAGQLGISVPAARRHLQDLQGAGLVSVHSERPGGRGRPQFVFVLTEEGEATFPKTYSALCVEVLRQVEKLYGPEGLRAVLDSRSAEVAEQLLAEVPAHLPLSERLPLLTEQLSRQGFDCVLEYEGGHWYVTERNCPNLQVAREYRELCDSECRMYSQVLGIALEREEHILCGQGRCRYRVG